MKGTFKVRAEIKGQFVIADTFDSLEKATAEYTTLLEADIFDTVDLWEVEA